MMLSYLKKFFTDETAFVGVVRGVLLGAAMWVATDAGQDFVGSLGPYAAAALGMVSGAIRSSSSDLAHQEEK